jgi:hypothetical protein
MDDIIKFENLARVLVDYATEVRNKYRDALVRSDRLASGKLLNSVEYHTYFNENEYLVYLSLEDYWKYVENDTVPHMPPVDKILEWIRVKPVLPQPYYRKWKWTTKDGKEHTNGKMVLPTPEEWAWIIAKGIEKNGTEGSHDLENTLEAVNARFEERIIKALDEDIASAVDVEIKMLVRPYVD